MPEPAVLTDAAEIDGLDDWRAIGRRQISIDSPAGQPLRGDESFVELSEEIQKLNSLDGERVAWDRVVQLGGEILSRKSKNLKVLGYTCLGLFEQNSYPGLLCGLCCLREMFETYWDGLYPEARKPTDRTRAIEWLIERLSLRIGQKPPSDSDHSVLESCLTEVGRIEDALRGKDLKDLPSFGPLRRALQNPLAKAASRPTCDKKVDPPQTTSKTDPAPPSRESPEVTLESAVSALRRVASNHREAEPTAPWPYRATRAAAWIDVDSCPPHSEGVTAVPPPPDHIREPYQRIFEKSSWADLLSRSESDVPGFPLWLDLQRYSGTALSCLGPGYSAASETVVSEARSFLRRLPGLIDLKFSDGTPFADPETRDWLEGEVLCESAGTVKADAVPPASGLDELRHLWATRKRAGRIKEALAAWQEEISRAASHRGQFLTRFELAKLCFASGYPRIAKAQLEILDRAIHRFSVDDWEPELARDVLLVWLRSFPARQSGKQADTESSREANWLYSRLCQLDPVAAADLDKTKVR